jgi:thioredoxin reductase (NADPH)
MFIRGASLEHSMSHHLTERVTSLANATVHTRIELTSLVVLTGTDPPEGGVQPIPLQTSVEGVFAIGDVRSGSSKRVASAVGAGVVAQMQRYVEQHR